MIATSVLKSPEERASAAGCGPLASSRTNRGAPSASWQEAFTLISPGPRVRSPARVTGEVIGIAVHGIRIPVDVGPHVLRVLFLKDSRAGHVLGGGARPVPLFPVVASQQERSHPGV